MVYLVSYDLIAEKDYSRIIGRIKQYVAWQQVLRSQWLVQSSSSVAAVRDDLMKYIDANDKLLVTEVVRGKWAGRWTLPQADWNAWNAQMRDC